MSYPKPWKSYQEQLDGLKARGLLVESDAKALEYLERIGYYRLSGYWYPFRKRSGFLCELDERGRKPNKIKPTRLALDEFRGSATFQNTVELYVFDKQLRMLVMDAIERIEIALRVSVAHLLGHYDKFAYLDSNLFHTEFSQEINFQTGLTKHHEWLSKHAQLISRSKEDFVRHNKSKYGYPLAIWVACEVWDFGALSVLYGGMREQDQDAISAHYGIKSGRIFATWLRSFNYLRNVCAHHSRLWNRNIIDQPKLPASAELAWVQSFEASNHARARCFLLLKMLQHMLKVINPNSSWAGRVEQHLLGFPDLTHIEIDIQSMGAPENWQKVWNQEQ